MSTEGVGGQDAGGQRPPERKRPGVSGRKSGQGLGEKMAAKSASESVFEANPDVEGVLYRG